MNVTWKLLALVVALCCALLSGRARADDPVDPMPAEHYRPAAVLIRLDPRVTREQRAALLAAERLTVEAEISALNVLSLAVPPGEEAATAAALRRQPGVLSAELDYRAHAALTPDDPNVQRQWAPGRVRAFEAWDITTGSPDVVVAAIDSGINLTHPDLAVKLWTNPGEIPGNGVDDDRNGKIDDVHGWRFYHNYQGGAYVPEEDARVADDYGHGTHVSGIMAAATNNGVGVAGLAWSSPVMPVKVLDQYGTGWYSDIAAGIIYAADNGARVINVSAGGKEASEVLCAAVTYARGRGGLVIASAGNNDTSVFYPAACEAALAIAATDPSDAPPAFSNAGPQVDLAAPGVDIYSTWYASGLGLSTYFSRSGTSVAAPQVSGVAALIRARWPSWTADQVARQLIGTAVDVDAAGWDARTGWGRIDAAAAVSAASQPADLAVSVTVAPNPVVAGNPVTTTLVISNAGPGLASSVTLTATLGAGGAEHAAATGGLVCNGAGSALACGANTLAAGAMATVTIIASPQVVNDGVLSVNAMVSAAQDDPRPADSATIVATTIQPVLAGWVFFDLNRDGLRQEWETGGVDGAWLTLEQTGQPVGQTRSSASAGAFRFDIVASGVYSLFVALPAGHVPTSPTELSVPVDAVLTQSVAFGVRPLGPDITITPSPTASRTVTPSATPTEPPTPTASVTPTGSPTHTASPTATPTVTATPTMPPRQGVFLPVLLAD